MDKDKRDIGKKTYSEEYSKGLYIFNKTEKVINAAYVITGLLGEKEPVKWSIREECMCLLKDVSYLKDIKDFSRMKVHVDSIQSALFTLVSLFEISAKSKILSDMNCKVLIQEIIKLSDTVSETLSTAGLGYSLNPGIRELGVRYADRIFEPSFNLDVGGSDIDGDSFDKEDKMTNSYKKNVQKNISQQGLRQDVRTTNRKDLKRHLNDAKGQDLVPVKIKGTHPERREKILSIIRDKEVVSIKDIAFKISDCSEKTIQRELLSLVEEGVLVKEGERRWSTYRFR